MDCKLIENKLHNQIEFSGEERKHIKSCITCQRHFENALENDDLAQTLDDVFRGNAVDEKLNNRIKMQLYGRSKKRLGLVLVAMLLLAFGTVYATKLYTYLPMFSKANETQTVEEANSPEYLIQNSSYRLIVKDINVDQRNISFIATILDLDGHYPQGKSLVFRIVEDGGKGGDAVHVTGVRPDKPWARIEFDLPLDYRIKDSVAFAVNLMDGDASVLEGTLDIDISDIKNYQYVDFDIDQSLQTGDVLVDVKYARISSTYLKVDLEVKPTNDKIIEMATIEATFVDKNGKFHALTDTYMTYSRPNHYELVFRFDQPLKDVNAGTLKVDGVRLSYMNRVENAQFDYMGNTFDLTYQQPRQSTKFAEIKVIDYTVSTQREISASAFPTIVVMGKGQRDRLFSSKHSTHMFNLTRQMINNIASTYGVGIEDVQVFSKNAIAYIEGKYGVTLLKDSLIEQIANYNKKASYNQSDLYIKIAQERTKSIRYEESTVLSPEQIYIVEPDEVYEIIQKQIELK